MNIPWGILHVTDVGIFDLSKNVAAVTKNRTWGTDSSFSHISPKSDGVYVFSMIRSISGQILDLIC